MNYNWVILALGLILLSQLEEAQTRSKTKAKRSHQMKTRSSSKVKVPGPIDPKYKQALKDQVRSKEKYETKLKKPSPLTLILDLDGTLIVAYGSHDAETHTTHSPLSHSFTFTTGLQEFRVRLRPGLEDFLKEVCEVYNCIIWTAKRAEYAKEVREGLAEQFNKDYFSGHYSLDDTINVRFEETDENFDHVKRLSTIKEPKPLDPQRTIVLEDTPANLMFDPKNGIFVPTFQPGPEEDTDDEILKEVSDYLMKLYEADLASKKKGYKINVKAYMEVEENSLTLVEEVYIPKIVEGRGRKSRKSNYKWESSRDSNGPSAGTGDETIPESTQVPADDGQVSSSIPFALLLPKRRPVLTFAPQLSFRTLPDVGL